MHEPAFEGADVRLVLKLRHFAGDADHRFLDDVLGFLVAETSADGGAVDQLPVRVEELAPARLIVEIAPGARSAKAAWAGVHRDYRWTLGPP